MFNAAIDYFLLEFNALISMPHTSGLQVGRDSGNDFCFPDFASHTGPFRLIFVRIYSVVSFWVDITESTPSYCT